MFDNNCHCDNIKHTHIRVYVMTDAIEQPTGAEDFYYNHNRPNQSRETRVLKCDAFSQFTSLTMMLPLSMLALYTVTLIKVCQRVSSK